MIVPRRFQLSIPEGWGQRAAASQDHGHAGSPMIVVGSLEGGQAHRLRGITLDALMGDPDFVTVERPDGGSPWRIARRQRLASADNVRPGMVWLGGFRSDMKGTKASFLDAHAREQGRALLRFDYSGHGESDGRFEDGCIGDWLEQSVALFLTSTQGPQIVVGASMGAWIALLLARRLAALNQSARLKALVLLAPAIDFTEELIWKGLTKKAQRDIMTKGVWPRPTAYAPEPTPITRRLIEDGRTHLLLGDVIRTQTPVHILQGMSDADVPWNHALALMQRLVCDCAVLSFVSGGDHRLSRPEDLALLADAVKRSESF
jgi:pimeloyl-ACP methyl ester carboxylesterase